MADSPQIGIRLPADVHQWVVDLAAPEEMSVAAYIKRAVERSHAKAMLRGESKSPHLVEAAEASGCGHAFYKVISGGSMAVCNDCGAVRGVDNLWRAKSDTA